MTARPTTPPAAVVAGTPPPTLLRRVWLWISGALAAVLGVAPHVLHHAGPLAGAALLGGVAGSLLFGAIGFLLAVPFLLRLRRRCGGWRVPFAVLGVMTVVFAFSTFVVGSAMNGGGEKTTTTQPGSGGGSGHLGHHGG